MADIAFNNTQALAEGWDLFEIGRDRLDLQRDDERALFPDDQAAVAFVAAKAAAGSAYHASALALAGI